MANDKTRYSSNIRYEFVLDDGEDYTKWAAVLAGSGVGSGSEHVSGSNSVGFSKDDSGSSAYVYKVLDLNDGLDLDIFSMDGNIVSSVYVPSVDGVSTYTIILYSNPDTQEGNKYTVSVSDLSVGWNHIVIPCNSFSSSSGGGLNWKAVKVLIVGLDYSSSLTTASGIIIDSVRLQIPVKSSEAQGTAGGYFSTVILDGSSESTGLPVVAAGDSKSADTKVALVQHLDSNGIPIRSGDSYSESLFVQDSQPFYIHNGDYSSPVDFTAVYSTSSGIEIYGVPFTPTIANFIGVVSHRSGSSGSVYSPKSHVFDYTHLTGSGLLNIGGASFESGDSFNVLLTGQRKGYSASMSANQTVDISPLPSKYSSETIADVTNETDASSDYYMSLDQYPHFQIQYFKTGGTDTCSLKVYGTDQDDGTASDSCLYQDITQYGMEPLNHSTASGSYNIDITLKSVEGSSWKYVKCNVATSGGSNDGDYKIFGRKWY